MRTNIAGEIIEKMATLSHSALLNEIDPETSRVPLHTVLSMTRDYESRAFLTMNLLDHGAVRVPKFHSSNLKFQRHYLD